MKKIIVKFISKAILLFGIFGVLTSCEKEVDFSKKELNNKSLTTNQITDHIVSLGFNEEGIVDHDDHYSVAENGTLFNKNDYQYLLKIPRDEKSLKGSKIILTPPLYRYYRSSTKSHFYTTNFSELGNGSAGYVYEGVECYVLRAGIFSGGSSNKPLYRWYNPRSGKHLYSVTTDIASAEYRFEGIQCYIRRTGESKNALNRYYDPSGKRHMLTKGKSELGNGKYGFYLEGELGFVLSKPIISVTTVSPGK